MFGGAVVGALLLKYGLALPLLSSGVCVLAVTLVYAIQLPATEPEKK